MLLKEEFTSNMGYLQPSINSMIVAAEGSFLYILYIFKHSVFLFYFYFKRLKCMFYRFND